MTSVLDSGAWTISTSESSSVSASASLFCSPSSVCWLFIDILDNNFCFITFLLTALTLKNGIFLRVIFNWPHIAFSFLLEVLPSWYATCMYFCTPIIAPLTCSLDFFTALILSVKLLCDMDPLYVIVYLMLSSSIELSFIFARASLRLLSNCTVLIEYFLHHFFCHGINFSDEFLFIFSNIVNTRRTIWTFFILDSDQFISALLWNLFFNDSTCANKASNFSPMTSSKFPEIMILMFLFHTLSTDGSLTPRLHAIQTKFPPMVWTKILFFFCSSSCGFCSVISLTNWLANWWVSAHSGQSTQFFFTSFPWKHVLQTVWLQERRVSRWYPSAV